MQLHNPPPLAQPPLLLPSPVPDTPGGQPALADGLELHQALVVVHQLHQLRRDGGALPQEGRGQPGGSGPPPVRLPQTANPLARRGGGGGGTVFQAVALAARDCDGACPPTSRCGEVFTLL